MKFNSRSALIAACVIVGCHAKSSLERQVQGFIATKCHGVWPCSVNLRDATSFEWDELYVFKYNASKSEIESATHATLVDYKELTRYMVFVRAGKAIRIESEPTNVEHPIKNELVFEIPDENVYRAFPASTEFTVIRADSEEGSYFVLKAE